MAEKKDSKKQNRKHLWDIPKRFFPRNTKSKEYLSELLRLTNTLVYVNTKIQHSSQVCSFNIKSITNKKCIPPKREDVFREIKEFIYHYENYCFRLYAYREKII